MKVGDEYFEAWADPHEGTMQIDLWVITQVVGGKAHAIRKSPHTWVKVSSKTGDYGWAKNLTAYDRSKFAVAEGPPAGWARTKAAACTKALPEIEAAIKKLTKIRAQLLGQRTKARSRVRPAIATQPKDQSQ